MEKPLSKKGKKPAALQRFRLIETAVAARVVRIL